MYSQLAAIPRAWKKRIIALFDLSLVPISLVLALGLASGAGVDSVGLALPLLVVVLVATLVFTFALGTHRLRLEAFDTRAVQLVGEQALAIAGLGLGANALLKTGVPASVPVILGAMFFVLSVAGRFAAKSLLMRMKQRHYQGIPVAIYGAGSAGMQLAGALAASCEYRPRIIVDDNPTMQGLIISGHRVAAPSELPRLVALGKVQRVFLAMPSAGALRQREILSQLSSLGCPVRKLPSYAELIGDAGLVDSLGAINTDDLLGREAVTLNVPDIENTYAGRVVMVTGAGGSIGSELCRQLLECRPRKIILFEQSEYALYAVDRELGPVAQRRDIALRTVLGSVTDGENLRSVMTREGVEIVLHAAAYKHVPMIEENEIEGVRNNVFGTQSVADAARASGVGRFILISTDKAVRPTNVMGASKRVAEMVVQDMQRRPGDTVFSMVRFGNVLGSSGSVVPLFREQIMAGGPVTLTHPEVTRFFMTIPEAARLVLLAGAYSEGGEVFVLDMGAPVKILDLARRMIGLAGKTVREAANPGGDIAIEVTGLRPGEKLYEELLIDADGMLPTPHPKILRAADKVPQAEVLGQLIQNLAWAIDDRDSDRLRQLVFEEAGGISAPQWAPALQERHRAVLAVRSAAGRR